MSRLGVVVVVVLCWWPARAAAVPELRWRPHAADIAGLVTLEVRGAGVLPDELRVGTSGGTIGEMKRSARGVTVVFTPPRVAAATEVVVRAHHREQSRSNAELRLTVVPASSPRPSRSTGGPFRLTLPRVVGEGPRVLRFEMPPGHIPRVVASAGAAVAVALDDAGHYEATYTPPPRAQPQHVAIVVIDERSGVADWGTMELYGVPRVKTSSTPGAMVRVRVAGVEFGPWVADERGRQALHVMVPPDERFAEVLATSIDGQERSSTISLGVADYPHQMAVCPHRGRDVWLVAFDGHGMPRDVVNPRLASPAGPVARVFAGMFRAVLPHEHGEEVRAMLGGATVRCRVQRHGGAPQAIVATTEPSFTAGQAEPVRVRIEARYRDVAPEEPLALRFESSLGTVSSVVQREDGALEAQWRLPNRFRGSKEAVLSALSVAHPSVRARVTLSLRAASAARLEAEVVGGDVVAGDSAELRVEARDRFGNPVTAGTMEIEAAGGVTKWARRGDARVARYTAPDWTDDATDELTIRSGELHTKLLVGVRPRRHRVLISLRGGYITNFAQVSTPLAWLSLEFRLPLFDENLWTGVESGAFYVDAGGPDRVTGVAIDAEVLAFPVLGRLSYQYPIGVFAPHVGAALGAVVVRSRVGLASLESPTSLSARFALAPLLGTSVELGPGRVGLELKYLYATIDEVGIVGQVGGFNAAVGYGLAL